MKAKADAEAKKVAQDKRVRQQKKAAAAKKVAENRARDLKEAEADEAADKKDEGAKKVQQSKRIVRTTGPSKKTTTRRPTKSVPKSLAPHVRVDPSDLTLSKGVNKMLIWYSHLSEVSKGNVRGCNLNMKPAMNRCETMHGKGKCVKINETLYGKVCPVNT
jgi:hypothetical protein